MGPEPLDVAVKRNLLDMADEWLDWGQSSDRLPDKLIALASANWLVSVARGW